jgi:hypothetical protein
MRIDCLGSSAVHLCRGVTLERLNPGKTGWLIDNAKGATLQLIFLTIQAKYHLSAYRRNIFYIACSFQNTPMLQLAFERAAN